MSATISSPTFFLTFSTLVALALLHSLRRPSFKHYLLTSLTIAAVALTNLIALYSVALIMVIILVSEALKGEVLKKIRITLICITISYGLAAFWYDWSFIKASISFGIASSGGYVITGLNFIELGLIFTALLLGLILYFKKEEQDRFIVYAWTSLFFIIVAVWYFLGTPLAPQPGRYVPELNSGVSILLAIAIVQVIDRFARNVQPMVRRVWKPLTFAMITVVVLTLPFTKFTWEITQPNQNIESAPEYKVARWFEDNADGQRVFATGTVGFWLNVFTDVLQLRGSSDQGSTNPWWIHVAYELDNGNDGRLGVQWCKALSIKYVLVIYQNADTPYHDSVFPDKFEDILPLRYSYRGFGVFEVPLNHSELVQTIDVSGGQHFIEIKGVSDVEGLSSYVTLVESTSAAMCKYWFEGVDRLRVSIVNATEETSILVKMTFDERWKGYIEGREVAVTEIGPSFMLLSPMRLGSYELELVCGQTIGEIAGVTISIITVILILGFSVYSCRKWDVDFGKGLSSGL